MTIKTTTSKDGLKGPPSRSKPVNTDKLFDGLLEAAKGFVDGVKDDANIESNQEQIRGLQSLLKRTADLQREIGVLKSKASSQIAKQRQANPKGKPEEGTIRETSKGAFIYMDGAWFAYSGKPNNTLASEES